MNRQLVTAQVMLPFQANLTGNIHGGEIMKLMDSTAGALARKYSKGNCVTARVDALEFLLPILAGALVTCTATVVYVGKSSMEILVCVEVEDFLNAEGPKKALSAYFTMVAVDGNGKPRAVTPYHPQTDEDIRLFEEAKKRRMRRESEKTPEQ